MAHCTLKDCPYDQDGRCVENQLPNCPNLVPEKPVTKNQQEETPSTPEPVKYEDLYAGTKLTADEATRMLQSNRAQLVVLGGGVESGKTTLLARVFEMFQSGGVADLRFASSNTLRDFDKLSWHATMECDGVSPDTEHTYRSENNRFLHLRIRVGDCSEPPTDLLIGDIPGEIFPEAIAEQSVCRNLCALGAAHHLVLFLDGGVLSHTTDRHDHCGKVFDFVDQALQTGQIGRHTILHLVVSKSDLLPIETTSEVRKYVKGIEKAFHERFTTSVGSVRSWYLAARPDHPFDPTLEEIAKMFKEWMNPELPHTKVPTMEPERLTFQRDFCCFGL